MPKIAELGKLQGISISFTQEQYETLVALAQQKRRPIAFLVREAVDEYTTRYQVEPSADDVVASLTERRTA